MRLEYDAAAEDFILIEQGRVVAREFVDRAETLENALDALALLRRLRESVKASAPRPSLTAPPPAKLYDEAQVRRFTAKGRPALSLADLDFEDLDLEDLCD